MYEVRELPPNAQFRVDREKLGLRDEDDPSSQRRGLALVYETYSQQMQLEKGLRSLVYYTNLMGIHHSHKFEPREINYTKVTIV